MRITFFILEKFFFGSSFFHKLFITHVMYILQLFPSPPISSPYSEMPIGRKSYNSCTIGLLPISHVIFKFSRYPLYIFISCCPKVITGEVCPTYTVLNKALIPYSIHKSIHSPRITYNRLSWREEVFDPL